MINPQKQKERIGKDENKRILSKDIDKTWARRDHTVSLRRLNFSFYCQ